MYLLFDIGGTKMRLAVSRDGRSFDEPKVYDTPANFDKGIQIFKSFLKESGEKIKAAAGGIAGPFDKKKGVLINSPNISGWVGRPLRKTFEKAIGAPVHIENDSALVGLGEAKGGAGKGRAIVAYIAPGTGLGGARIVDGKIDKSAVGFEPGHQIIDFNAKDRENFCLDCDHAGHLESYVGGASVKKRFGKDPKEITDGKTWNEIAKYLAYGLNNIAVLWSPDIIVLGGSMILGTPGISVEKVRVHLKEIMKIFPAPPIKKAELKDFGGLYGALEILKAE